MLANRERLEPKPPLPPMPTELKTWSTSGRASKRCSTVCAAVLVTSSVVPAGISMVTRISPLSASGMNSVPSRPVLTSMIPPTKDNSPAATTIQRARRPIAIRSTRP